MRGGVIAFLKHIDLALALNKTKGLRNNETLGSMINCDALSLA